MIAFDTNILVYAHRRDAEFHGRARRLLIDVARGQSPWAIPWPCVHEFLAVVTNPRVFRTPTPLSVAIEEVRGWAGSPSVRFLSEADGYLEVLRGLLDSGRPLGAQVHDARMAAICLHHGVSELWSADRDFGRYPALRVSNPLVTAAGD